MQIITIGNTTYQYASDYKNDDVLRVALNQLTKDTFNFSFENWYKDGYWNSRYVPYTLFDGSKAIANVSICAIDFLVLGEKKTFVQIGTVMTAKEYRNKGLSRYLMERVLSEWKNKCDMIYLYANDDVKDFYPKFGFVPVNEYEHTKDIKSNNTLPSPKALNLTDKQDKALLQKYIRESKPISQVSMLEGEFLIMFHASFMSSGIYYIEEQDCVVFAEKDDEVLIITDIFSPHKVDIDDVASRFATETVKKLKLDFIPIDTSSFECTSSSAEDSTLFIQKGSEDLFLDNKLMFPHMSHT